jgi:hypothetical protein
MEVLTIPCPFICVETATNSCLSIGAFCTSGPCSEHSDKHLSNVEAGW